METNTASILLLCIFTSSLLLPCCDGIRSKPAIAEQKLQMKMKMFKYLDVVGQKIQHLGIDGVDSPNTEPYPNSPFSLPPFDSLPPIPLPPNAPPYCIYPPNTPQTPAITIPTPYAYAPPPPPFYSSLPPLLPIYNPPPPPAITIPTPYAYAPPPPPFYSSLPPLLPIYNPPPPPAPAGTMFPSPPEISVPSPTIYFPTPPTVTFTPPSVFLPPPHVPVPVPSPPTAFLPSPPTVFEPPVVYPPPSVPPPPNSAPDIARWCVAKPSVPDPIIQEAMNYACGSGADCDSIQPNGFCFHPDTLFAHASFAFNSYWQRTKVAGGTCDFGGTAMFVTVDPSYDGCHFIYY